jgi:hypothetical protein
VDSIEEAELIIGWFEHKLVRVEDMDNLPPFYEAREMAHKFMLARHGFHQAKMRNNQKIMAEVAKEIIKIFDWLESNGYVKERRPYT